MTIGMVQRTLVLHQGARLFRARLLAEMPTNIREVGQPPQGLAPIGRVNEDGQSVLYLADSPDTAFAESRATAGQFCLSEWMVDVPKLAMANGGISEHTLRPLKSIYEGSIPEPVPTQQDKAIAKLFREIYTLDADASPNLYNWSIACGRANGFASKCHREELKETDDGMTEIKGRYPFSAIAYPSVRAGGDFLNYAFNDLGQSHVALKNIQWIHRDSDGRYAGIDFASAWDDVGNICWEGRPANIQIQGGERGKLTKVAENIWSWEAENGGIPWFV